MYVVKYVRYGSEEYLTSLCTAYVCFLMQRFEMDGGALDGRRSAFFAPSASAVRLRHGQHDLLSCPDQFFKHRNGKIRRTHKQDPHIYTSSSSASR